MNKFFITLLAIFLSVSAKSQKWDSLQEGIPYVLGPRVMYADTIDNYLYTGGNFYFQTNGKQINMIARWNGLQWDTMGIGIYGAGNVLTMERYKGELYVGGGFDSAGGKSARNIAKWNGTSWDTLPIQPFTHHYNGSPDILKAINNELYMGGVFDSLIGDPCTSLAKWNGINWTCIGMPPNLTGLIYVVAICEYNNEIYLAGNFSSSLYPNDTIQDILRYDGSNWKSVGGGMKGAWTGIESMVVYNGELYVAGYFFVSDGNVGNHIQKWNGTSWRDVGGGTNLNNGQIHKLLVHNGKLYAMGVLQMAGGVPTDRIAVWDGTNWCGLGSVFDNVIMAGCIYKDTLYIGGGFKKIDNDSINHIAQWTGGSYVDSCGNTSGINENDFLNEINIYPNPAHNELNIALNDNRKYTCSIKNILGQTIAERSFIGNISFDVTTWVKGMFFIELRDENGIRIRTEKVIIE